ncbi:4-hydroxythreonine-4-phosphate dehydrogenase PdxA [Ideonella sp. BN130291]|uniref:4-hydroxythreonine-4-phosphate dehydrogenase PdxA n=1 Tax=Ideonella sp. BN130291 TaxID=3112940 RepID=UPI002E26BFDE|nr:4-hydroxythreonine-4-phosphate dehydrogenase PdxA [Ideonella sp. BN130291]
MSAPVATSPGAPWLGITMGDPCGIGPEIVAQAIADGRAGRCVVIGDVAVMRRALRQLGRELPVAQLHELVDAAQCPPACLPVWVPPGLPEGLVALPMGQVNDAAGAAAACCIEAGARAAMAGRIGALVTAPVHKEALAAAGVPYPGHTEMLQALAAAPGGALPPVRMMLANDELRTVLVTIHLSLRKAIDQVTFDAVLQSLRIAHAAAARWGQPQPRIAVAGLNPHAGEGGLFGDEELRIIGPAVQAARAEGIDASGPYAPDTVFMRARHAPPAHPGEFDIVVAMTHDHGLIPVKYLGVEQGVNVTLGLPFVRTSPDHGTAFDIAGKGVADAASLVAAVHMARRLSRG